MRTLSIVPVVAAAWVSRLAAASSSSSCADPSKIYLDLAVVAHSDTFEAGKIGPSLADWTRESSSQFRALRTGIVGGTSAGGTWETLLPLTHNTTTLYDFDAPSLPPSSAIDGSLPTRLAELQSLNTIGWTLLPNTNSGGYRTLRLVVVPVNSAVAVTRAATESELAVLAANDVYTSVMVPRKEIADAFPVENLGLGRRAEVRITDDKSSQRDRLSTTTRITRALSAAVKAAMCAELPEKEGVAGVNVQLMFAVDNTVSMGRFAESLRAALPKISRAVEAFEPDALETGLLSFNDKPHFCSKARSALAPVNYCAAVEVAPKQGAGDEIARVLENMKFDFGDVSSREDLAAALSLGGKTLLKKDAVKFIVLFSDALPHNKGDDDFLCGMQKSFLDGHGNGLVNDAGAAHAPSRMCRVAQYDDFPTSCGTATEQGIRLILVTSNSVAKAGEETVFARCSGAVLLNSLSRDSTEVAKSVIEAIERSLHDNAPKPVPDNNDDNDDNDESDTAGGNDQSNKGGKRTVVIAAAAAGAVGLLGAGAVAGLNYFRDDPEGDESAEVFRGEDRHNFDDNDGAEDEDVAGRREQQIDVNDLFEDSNGNGHDTRFDPGKDNAREFNFEY